MTPTQTATERLTVPTRNRLDDLRPPHVPNLRELLEGDLFFACSRDQDAPDGLDVGLPLTVVLRHGPGTCATMTGLCRATSQRSPVSSLAAVMDTSLSVAPSV